ncbi:50S ribosomal protein L15 [Candidatus Curtissbacteria bacterium RIFCSPLOWO2_01_FULL_42_26]|uniref:Large ribosomal subunit protein uL15 n=1 Tax=Candidatus Curtissbacteria bacterium RIFCSPLOWO2_01_FULL_42_26 TaxID=1797729 RepID=A0A1F5I2S9_9BACT|nr:MAG: 50S ribosomal protein L15 [Candidatus Curtissbacteria bacterium RIFCSPLOWO2_01_FULL_42_26]
MKLNSQPKLKIKSARRIGRGAGSGRGKTAGKGTKGQNARGKLSITHAHFEGGQRPLFKRLPYRRGKGNSRISKKPLVVNLKAINIIPKSENVSLAALIKYQIVDAIDAKTYGVKILGDGKLEHPYTFTDLKISKSAAEKIQKSGGKITGDQMANAKLKSNSIINPAKNTKKEKGGH